jgi:hypothetical protein
MKTQVVIKIELPSGSEVISKKIDPADEQKYKQCPYCGQSKIPFKMGVCICGKQVGNITYVNNAETYAKSWYAYLKKPKVEKLGIVELMDN